MELSSIVSLIFSSNQIFDSSKVFLIFPGKENKALFLKSDFKVFSMSTSFGFLKNWSTAAYRNMWKL